MGFQRGYASKKVEWLASSQMTSAGQKNEALSGPTSDDLESTPPVAPAKTRKSNRVPSTKRRRQFDRQVQMAKAAILSGEIEPKARPIAEHCQCAYRTALSILQILTDQGIVVRDGRGWKRAA